MIKIDKAMPSMCEHCNFYQIAYDSELFKDGEPYCCIEGKSVEVNMDTDTKPKWCPLIDENAGCDCCQGDEALYWADDENNAFVDSRGDVLVTVKGITMRYKVKCCPNCGKEFTR